MTKIVLKATLNCDESTDCNWNLCRIPEVRKLALRKHVCVIKIPGWRGQVRYRGREVPRDLLLSFTLEKHTRVRPTRKNIIQRES